MLTATIDPRLTPLVARSDPQVRLNDYRIALKSWLSSGVSTIVFVENSGYRLDALKEIARGYPRVRTEFISLNPAELTAQRGKGYGELTLMHAAFEQSSLLREAQFVAKCTGRLTLLNIGELLRQLDGLNADLFCTFKRNLTFADSRFFIARPTMMTGQLFPLKDTLDDGAGVFFENVLARASLGAVAAGFKWSCFPVFPNIAGVSGTFNTTMTDRPWIRAAKVLYHALRRYVYEH
ncbi:hypothetical protein [Hydrocarboniphaga sp.]|uniref:hypothetical protein n=1 Tax=Hydrocarboniphaga sp. TaxID=2033016 RepID=UPI002633EEED|nr:hypothetical protein [Hydrocarboniphaga sp.]